MVIKNLLSSIGRKMQRKLIIKKSNLTDTPLSRCLSLPEIVFIGMSLMINGIFVTIPTVVHNYSGPGIVFSFLLAGIAAVLSAFSYAEMGSRVPRAGSGYVYVSVSLGEIWGFLAGWNMLLEYALTCAAMSRSFTSTLFVIVNSPNVTHTMEDINWTIAGQQTDIIAACVVLLFAAIVALGVKLTSILNAVLNFTAVGITLGICVFAFLGGDIRNWTGNGDHNFFPYGFGGIVAGGSVCYFSYIGFESITVASEETKDPHKTIPLAIGIVFVIMSFLYILCSLSFTYYAPYLAFKPNFPIAQIMLDRGAIVASVMVGIAGIMAVCTNIVVCLNSIPRITYAMASDGLLWPCFQRIHPSTQTPLLGMAFAGLFVAVVTFFFELQALMSAVSVGTLFSYILVSIGTIYLRYVSNEPQTTYRQMSDLEVEQDEGSMGNVSSTKSGITRCQPGARKPWLKEWKHTLAYWPDVRPVVALGVMTMFMIVLSVVIAVALRTSTILSAWCICISVCLLVVIIICIVHLTFYEQNIPEQGTFRMPAMPLIPAISILMNLIFMMMLSYYTWIRLVVWVAAGLLIYFTYSIRHSTNNEEQVSLNQPVQLNGTADYGTTTDGM